MRTYLRNIAKRLYRKVRPMKSPVSPQNDQNTHSYPKKNPDPPPKQTSEPKKSTPTTPKKPNPPQMLINITETPNPNACKYDIPHQISEKAFSFSTKNPPQNHPLAQKILAIPEILSIFGVGNFITVTKSSQTQWAEIHHNVETILQEHFSSQ